jgi:hypothetical protein
MILPNKIYRGRISQFGGPEDFGVSAGEGLAIYHAYSQAPDFFLKEQPPGTTGLARRLNVNRNYCAMRWSYRETNLSVLRKSYVMIEFNGKSVAAKAVDWGPNERTGRIIDVSPAIMKFLGCQTDDIVEACLICPVDV